MSASFVFDHSNNCVKFYIIQSHSPMITSQPFHIPPTFVNTPSRSQRSRANNIPNSLLPMPRCDFANPALSSFIKRGAHRAPIHTITALLYLTMGRILQGFLIIAVAVVSALVYSYRAMTSKTAHSIALLKEELNETTSPLSPQQQQQVFDNLPPVVQTYLTKALTNLDKQNVASHKRIKSLTMKQKGTFQMGNHWVPFTATQYFSAVPHNIGFVWDAMVFMAEPVPTFVSKHVHLDLAFFVQDTHVRGKGLLEARLLGVLPVAHLEDSPDINAGELMRWLAESMLFPTVLLPSSEQGGVQWTGAADQDPNKARVSVQDSHSKQTKVSLTVQFDETTGLPVSVMGMRAKATGDEYGIGGVSYTRWSGNMRDYVEVDGMMVPTKFDAGWWEGEKKLQLYFKGENYDLQYEYY